MLRRKTSIIKISIKETLKQIKGMEPKVVYNTFYGAYDIAPYNLVIWYFFKTNEDWSTATSKGLTDEISKLTVSNMIKNGYPASAFEVNVVPLGEGEFIGWPEGEKEKYIYDATHCQVLISFSSEQDVKEKANGDYYYYFK